MENYRGDIFAVLTAISWSMAVIFFKLSGQYLSTVPLKLFQNVVAVLLFMLSIWVLNEPFTLRLSTSEWLRVVVSAVIGISLGDTWFVAATNRLGPGLQAIVDSLYMPFVMALAFVFFNESVPGLVLVGAALVVAAIFLAHRDASGHSVSRRQLWSGISYAVLAQLAMAACVVMVKDLLAHHSLLTLTTYRFAIGTAFLALIAGKRTYRAELVASARPRRSWFVLLPGAILGPYLATLFWFAGFKYTLAGKAAVYNQLSTVLIIALAAVILGERLTGTRLTAIVIALVGGFLVALTS